MKLLKTVTMLFAHLGCFLGGNSALANISKHGSVESVDSENESIEKIILNIGKDKIDLVRLEQFINEMKLNFEITSFDGEILELKMPHRDKVILAQQIEVAPK